MDRRRMLASMGAAAAGAAFLNEAVGQDQNPAAQVEDRGSSIKISALRALPAGRKVYLKIETSAKVVGWGEVTGLDPAVATRVEHLWQKIYRSHRDMRGGPFMTNVLSGIDMALWDITGKLYGVPVYRLLGGPCRDKIRLYPSEKAHKCGTGGPHPWSGGPKDIENLVERRSGPTAPSCSTPTAPCRRRC